MERIRSLVSTVSSLYFATPLQKMLYESTDNNEIIPTPDLLFKISEQTFDSDSASIIYQHIWHSLDPDSKNASKILKGLSLVEYLIKFGSNEVVSKFVENIYRIRQLITYGEDEFVYEFTEIIRKKALHLNNILSNPNSIQQERSAAMRTHERCVGMSKNPEFISSSLNTQNSYTNSSQRYSYRFE